MNSSHEMNFSDEREDQKSISSTRVGQQSRQTFSLTERVGVVAAGAVAWVIQLLFKTGLLRRK